MPYARKTPLLAGQLAAVAAALAGRAGSRLARAVLAVEVSRHTLVRVLMALPEPAAGLVRVLGIDDFSLRKGRAYATLLVDMETGEPVDVLPDREAGHGGGMAARAPGGRGDLPGPGRRLRRGRPRRPRRGRSRWPTAGTCGTTCASTPARPSPATGSAWRGSGCAGQDAAGRPAAGAGAGAGAGGGEAGCPPAWRPSSASGTPRCTSCAPPGRRWTRRPPRSASARQLTGRFWRAASAEALLKTAGASALDPWKPYLRRRWDAGHHQHRGPAPGDHRAGLPRQRAHHLQLAGPAQARRPAEAARPARETAGHQVDAHRPRPPGRRRAGPARRHPRPLPRTARPGRARHRVRQDAHRPPRRPASTTGSPPPATAPALASFANGIRQDYQAVRNALTLEWNSGRVEGLNTRTKLLQRQMYGRAMLPAPPQAHLLTS